MGNSKKFWLIAGMALIVALLTSCQPSYKTSAVKAQPEEGCPLPYKEEAVDMAKTRPDLTSEIPSIDSAVPIVTETATFALG